MFAVHNPWSYFKEHILEHGGGFLTGIDDRFDDLRHGLGGCVLIFENWPVHGWSGLVP